MPRGKANNQSELIQLALVGIDARIAELEQKREELTGQGGRASATGRRATTDDGSQATRGKKRRRFSATTRAKLSAAAKARWSRAKGEKGKAQSQRAATKKAGSKAQTGVARRGRPARGKKSPAMAA